MIEAKIKARSNRGGSLGCEIMQGTSEGETIQVKHLETKRGGRVCVSWPASIQGGGQISRNCAALSFKPATSGLVSRQRPISNSGNEWRRSESCHLGEEGGEAPDQALALHLRRSGS